MGLMDKDLIDMEWSISLTFNSVYCLEYFCVVGGVYLSAAWNFKATKK